MAFSAGLLTHYGLGGCGRSPRTMTTGQKRCAADGLFSLMAHEAAIIPAHISRTTRSDQGRTARRHRFTTMGLSIDAALSDWLPVSGTFAALKFKGLPIKQASAALMQSDVTQLLVFCATGLACWAIKQA